MIPRNSFRWIVLANAAVTVSLAICGRGAACQSLSVLPVNVFLGPTQQAATMTVTNRSNRETAIQIRPFAWSQANGDDQLEPTRELMVSPPIATIAAGASQLVRLILRGPPGNREVAYRILLDQIPPPSEVGVVHIVFRLSIPVFSQPGGRTAPHVQYHVESSAGEVYLVGRNDGLRHEAIRDIVLLTTSGIKLTPERGESPYILAGATRRWRISAPNSVSLPNETLKFTARDDWGAITEQVRVVAKP